MSTSTEAPATDSDFAVSADSADSVDPPSMDELAAPGAFLGRIYRISAPRFDQV